MWGLLQLNIAVHVYAQLALFYNCHIIYNIIFKFCGYK